MTVLRYRFDLAPGEASVNNWKECTCVRGRGGRPKPNMRKSDVYRYAMVSMRLWAQRKTGGNPVFETGPVVVEIRTDADRTHRSGAAEGEGYLDADAVTKCVLDALQGAAYTDDAQVVRVVATKTAGQEPGISVCVYRPFPGTGRDDKMERQKLTSVDHRFLAQLRGHADSDGFWEGRMVELAEALGMSSRTLHAKVSRLEQRGAIKRSRGHGNPGQRVPATLQILEGVA